MVKGKMLDLAAVRPIERFDAKIVGTANYADTAGSDVVIVTAGLPRKPGMSRDDLIATNVKIVKSVAEQVAKHSPDAVMIVVSNPLDAMVYTAWKASASRRTGSSARPAASTSPASARSSRWSSACSVEDIQALLLGGHGDDMVPLPRYTSVHGIPVSPAPAPGHDRRLRRARQGRRRRDRQAHGHERLLRAGAAARSRWPRRSSRTRSASSPAPRYCEKEYGVGGYFVGVPCVLGAGGVEKVIEIELDADERKLMDESISHVKDLVKVVQQTFPELA